MSKTIDSKIVEMRFDNKQFESAVSQSLLTLDKLKSKLNFKDLASSINTDTLVRGINGIGNSVDNLSSKFSAMGVAAATVISNLTTGFMNAGSQLVKSLSVDQVLTGWQKYERLMESTQMMMSATRSDIGTVWADREEQMDYINDKIETLMWYTDETSYDFADMADNIGKFTANGVKLDDAVTAMIGVSNWAGISGANVSQAARAMYNLSQALAMGSVRIQDWMSIENANMATAEFKQHVIDIARELPKSAEIIKDVENDIGEVTAQNFRTTLSAGWFNTEVLTEVLREYGQFSIDLKKAVDETGLTATEYIGYIQDIKDGSKTLNQVQQEINSNDDYVDSNSAIAWIEKLSSAYYETGFAAMVASQQSKTFKDSVNATKDAVSSKWTKIFTTVMGDYLESVELWSTVSEEMYSIFVDDLDNLNRLLSAWGDLGGRERLLSFIKNVYYDIANFVGKIKEGFTDVFPATTAEDLYNSVDKIAKAVEKFSRINLTTEWSLNNVKRIGEEIGKMAGDIKKVFGYVGDAAANAWHSIFPSDANFFRLLIIDIGDALEKVRLKFDEFYWAMTWDRGELERTFKGLFAVLDILKQLVEAILRPILTFIGAFDPKVGDLVDTVLGFTASVGDSLVALDEWIRDTNYFGKVVSKVIEYLKLVPDVIDDLVFQVTGYHIMDYVNSFLDRCQDIPGIFMTLGEKIKTQGLFPTIVEVIDYVSDIPRKLITTIEEMSGLELMPQYDTFISKLKEIFSSLNSLIAFLAGIPSRINQACLDYLGYSVPEILGGIVLFILTLPKTINDVVVELTGIGLIDWFKKLGEVAKDAFEKIAEFLNGFKTGTDAEGNLIEYDSILEGIIARIKTIKESIEETIGKIKKLFGIEEKSTGILETSEDPPLLNRIEEKTESVSDTFKRFKDNIDGVLDSLNGEKAESDMSAFEKGLVKIKEAIEGIKNIFKKDESIVPETSGGENKKTGLAGFIESFKIDDPSKALKNLEIIGIVVGTIGGILSAITIITNGSESLGSSALKTIKDSITDPIGMFVLSIKDTGKAVKGIGSSLGHIGDILKFASIIGIILSLAHAIVELANLPTQSLGAALGAISILMLEVGIFMKAASGIENVNRLKVASTCLSMIGLVFIEFAAALVILNRFADPTTVKDQANTLMEMLGLLGGILLTLSLVTNIKGGVSPVKIRTIAESMVQLGFLMIELSVAIGIVGLVSAVGGDPNEAANALSKMVIVLGVILVAISLLSGKIQILNTINISDLTQVAGALNLLASSLILISAAILILAPITMSEHAGAVIAKSLVALLFPIAALAGAAILLTKFGDLAGNGDDLMRVAVAIDLMAASLLIIASAFLILNPIASKEGSLATIGKGLVALLLPIGALVGAALALTTFGKIGFKGYDIMKVALAIDLMAASLIIIATAFIMLTPLISEKGSLASIGKGLVALIVPLGILTSIAITLMSVGKIFVNADAIIKVAIAIDLMAASLILIATSFLILSPIISKEGSMATIGKGLVALLVPIAILGAVSMALTRFGEVSGTGNDMMRIGFAIDLMAASLLLIATSFLILMPITGKDGSMARIGETLLALLAPIAVLGAISMAFTRFGTIQGAGKDMTGVAIAIDLMAASLLLVATSFLMLMPITGKAGSIPRILETLLALMAPIVVMGVLALFFTNFDNTIKGRGQDIMGAAIAIDLMAAALLTVGAAFLMIKDLVGKDGDMVRIGESLLILLGPIAVLGVIAVFLSNSSIKGKGNDIMGAALAIDLMAAALLTIGAAFLMIRDLVGKEGDMVRIGESLLILLGPIVILGTLAGVLIALSKNSSGKDILMVAASFDAIAGALLIVAAAFLAISLVLGKENSWDVVAQGLVALVVPIVALGGIMSAMLALGKYNDGSDFLKIAAAFDLISVSLLIIAGSLIAVAEFGGNVDNLAWITGEFTVLLVVLGGLMSAFLALGKYNDGSDFLKIAAAFDLMSLSIAIIAGSLVLMNQYGGTDYLIQQAVALGLLLLELGGVFAGLALLSTKEGIDIKKMAEFAAVIDLLSLAFIGMAAAGAIIGGQLNSWKEVGMLLATLGGFSVILAGLALAVAGAGYVASSAAPGLTALAAALVAVGAAAAGIGLGFFLVVEGIEKISALGDISAAANANGAAVGGLVGFFNQIPDAAASATKGLDSFANEWEVNGEQIKNATMTIINGIFDIIEAVILGRLDRTLAIIGQVIDRLLVFVGQYGPKFVLLVNNLFASLKAAWPAFEAWLSTVVSGILNIIDANKDKVLVMFYNIGQSIISKLRLLWPNLKGLISEFAIGILEVIRDALPLFGEIVSETFSILINAIIENWPLLEQLLDMMLTTLLGDGTEENMGILQKFREPIKNLILGLLQDAIDGITESSAMIIESIITVVLGLLDSLIENIGPITEKTFELVFELVKGVLDSFTEENIKELAESGINFVLGIVNGIADATEDKAEDIRAAMEHVVESMINSFCTILGIESPYKTGTASSTGNLFLDAGTNIILGLIDGISDGQDDVEKCIETIGKALLDAFKKKLGIHSPSKEFEDNGTNVIQGLIDGLEGEDILSDLEKAIKNAASKLFESFCKKLGIDPKNVSKGATEMLNAGKSAIAGVIEGIEAKIIGLKQEISSAAAKVKEVFISKSPDFEDAGYYVIEGIRKGINNFKSRVTSVISGIATSAISKFKDVLGIESPSKVFAELGQYVDMGFIEGLKNNAGDVFETTDWLGEESINEFTGIIDKISDFMDSNLDSAPTITPVLDLSEFSDGLGDMNGLMTSNSSWDIDAEQTSALASKATDYLTTHDLSDPTALFNDLRSTFTNMFKDKIGTTNVTFNVTGDNPKEIAEEIEHIIQDKIIKKESVWE